MRIRLWKYVIYIRKTSDIDNDDVVRNDAKEFMSKHTINCKDRIFTGMDLHYTVPRNTNLSISNGVMFIRN